MKTTATVKSYAKNYTMGTALALVMVAGANIQAAQAACSPDSPTGASNGATINCTGATNNGTNGFQVLDDNTINVTSPGASVTGTQDGIRARFGNTINVGAGNSVTGINGVGIGTSAGGTSTVANSGSITGSTNGITNLSEIVLTNNVGGVIQATNGDGVNGNNGTVTNGGVIIGLDNGLNFGTNGNLSVTNTGTIIGTGLDGIHFQSPIDFSVGNSGTIKGGAVGVHSTFAATPVTITNSGVIAATAASGVGIQAGSGTINNSGTIAGALDTTGGVTTFGGRSGVEFTDPTGSSTVTNSGTIGGGIFGIFSQGQVNLTNSGLILGPDGNAINIASGSINNTGVIGAASDAFAIVATNASATLSITNSGTITSRSETVLGGILNITNLAGGQITAAINSNSEAIAGNSGTINNAGLIRGNTAIEFLRDVTVFNSGSITGETAITTNAIANVANTGLISSASGDAIFAANGANVTNNVGGRITSAGGTGIAVTAGGLTVVNAGLVSGLVGISVGGGPANLTNFGTITGTGGTAIQLSSADDTLNLKAGSQINGNITLGGGIDVINVENGSTAPPQTRGVSFLAKAAGAVDAVIAAIKAKITDFDATKDTINVINVGNAVSTGGQPIVVVNGVIAALDPTALAQQDRVLMDVAGGVSSTIQGRLGSTASAPGVQMMSYAMDDRTSNAKAQMFTKAPVAAWNAPVNVWTSGFGGIRHQDGTDTTLNSTSSVFGGTLGVDRQVRPDLLVGLFAGGGGSTLSVDQSSQKIDSDYVFGGAYAHKTWGAAFVDTTLQVGGITNRSSRLINNTITGGLEHAAANSHGWFISPEIAYGYHLTVGQGYTLTPIARVRYVAGFFDGSNESGSTQTLSIGNRTLQDFEERAELEFSRVGLFGNTALKTTLHGGFMGLQRVGDTAIGAVLIGQGLTFATPGHASAVGGVFGASFDYAVAPNTVLFGAAEGQFMSDQSQTVAARGGLKVAF